MNEDQIPMIERGEVAVSGDGDNTPIEWRGLPQFVPKPKRISLSLSFETTAERDALLKELAKLAKVSEVPLAKKTGDAWSAPWPPSKQEDLAALRFDFGE